MQYIDTVVRQLPCDGFKVCVWGQADGHITDWDGCNYRIRSVDGQPLRGFPTKEEAIAFAHERFPTRAEAIAYASNAGDGSFFTDDWDEDIVAERFVEA